MKQQTLKSSFTLQGKGLHTGLDIEITFLPAPENHGYKIQRVDLDGQPVLDAVAENVINTQRGTVLGKNDITVSTIEHAMAALYASEIDNCLIQVNAPEFPILDGSAQIYVENIMRVGIEEQSAEKDYYIIRNKVEITDEESGSSIIALPDDHFSISTMVLFNSPQLPVCLSRRYEEFLRRDRCRPHIRFCKGNRTFVEKQPHQRRRPR